ncbi:hypothetical protein [Nocardioides sp. GY 10127]|uniref:hypothetical protein n=1 Tax=Nocardioides sp. GY 10127 TaxID=2569762 RepID=UPI0010A76839|nr:hypothetical protein [Nocardioides sp. GY 10127]TIC80835.1 hypothetical protein E8D37_13365 [Nocardioides sp. GY 10127]
MTVIVCLAVGILFYVAYPHQGRELEQASGLSKRLIDAAFRVPVLRDGDVEADPLVFHDESDAAPARSAVEQQDVEPDVEQGAQEHAVSSRG